VPPGPHGASPDRPGFSATSEEAADEEAYFSKPTLKMVKYATSNVSSNREQHNFHELVIDLEQRV